jgi:hypothetical protein
MTRLEAVPATPELVARFYDGKPAPFTFRGYAGMIGDRVVGLAGIHYRAGQPVVFADIGEGLSKWEIGRGIGMLKRLMLNDWKGLLYAICDQERETAHRTLTHLGFAPMGNGPWYMRVREGEA